MIKYDDAKKENIKEHDTSWTQILNHPYKILIFGGSGSRKTNSLFKLINKQLNIEKVSLYTTDTYEAKYQLLINKRESTGLKHLNGSKVSIEYSNYMDDIYKNIEEHNPNKKRKILTVLNDMIVDMLSNKKLNPIATELFIRGRKLNISLVFITQSYFAVPKNSRLNSVHYFIMKIPNKRELQEIVFNHSSDIGFKNFMNLCIKCAPKPYSSLVIDSTIASNNPSSFRKILLKRI